MLCTFPAAKLAASLLSLAPSMEEATTLAAIMVRAAVVVAVVAKEEGPTPIAVAQLPLQPVLCAQNSTTCEL